MCGIAGFIDHGRGAGSEERVARRMADAIAHRGPDDDGVWTDRAAGVALAHRRLSIIDLSPAGHQPMTSASGRFVLTFNGEIYNHAELRAELEHTGSAPQWRGHSDTEVLLEAISAWGIRKALERFVGMFAFGLWDRYERTLTLARDRLGEKPLYYGWSRGTFLFGSEVAALREHPDWQGDLDRNALGLLLRYNHVPAPHSIYRGIRKLPAGTFFLLNAETGKERLETYWDAAEMATRGILHPFEGSPEEAADQTEHLARQSLKGQMMADVPLGTFLSGGVDSSTVTALLQAMSSQPVRTFSIGFEEDGYDEAHHAKDVAHHLGTDHTELYVTMREAMAVVPRLPTLYSEPFADASQIPTFLVSMLARRHVTVALSGDGGDELFSGYSRYRFADQLWPAIARVPLSVRRAASDFICGLSPDRWNRLLRRPMRMLPARIRQTRIGDKIHKIANVLHLHSSDDAYATLVSHCERPGDIVIGSSEFESRSSRLSLTPLIKEPARRMMYFDLVGYLPDDVLVKVDRASMAAGLECRVPLLDHRLVEFSWSLPLKLLRRHGQSKWPLRRVLDRYVPRQLIERPKMGFSVPIGDWLRGPLRDWAESLLDERRLVQDGIFQAGPIRAAWHEHLTGRRNLQHQLWGILMFQAWHQAQRSAAQPRSTASARA